MPDAHEEFYRRQRQEDEKENAFARELFIRGVAFILDLPGGVSALLSRAFGEASSYLATKQTGQLASRVEDVESRLARYDGGSTTRISGARVQLLEVTLNAALQKIWDGVDSGEAMIALGLTPDEYGEAAHELEELGLVYADPSATHAAGIVRTRIREAAALQVGPTLRPDIDWERDVAKILISIVRDRTEGYQFAVQTLAEKTEIPPPRLSLLLDALEALGLIEGGGPGSYEFGSFHFVDLTIRGRRVLRGDASVL